MLYAFKITTMATGRNHKYIPKSSKYKYVAKYEGERGMVFWYCKYKGSISFKTEREAAIAVDKKLIAERKEPINILVRK